MHRDYLPNKKCSQWFWRQSYCHIYLARYQFSNYNIPVESRAANDNPDSPVRPPREKGSYPAIEKLHYGASARDGEVARRTKSTEYLSEADEGSIINITGTINQKAKRRGLTLVDVVLGLELPMPMAYSSTSYHWTLVSRSSWAAVDSTPVFMSMSNSRSTWAPSPEVTFVT